MTEIVTKKVDMRPRQTVYPDPRIGPVLGGYRSPPMTRALECWAKLLEDATCAVGKQFSAAEWNYLYASVTALPDTFLPQGPWPGQALAHRAEQGCNYGVRLSLLSRQAEEAAQFAKNLADRLAALDYIHAWAVIWAIEYRQGLPEPVKPQEEWWTLAHRYRSSQ